MILTKSAVVKEKPSENVGLLEDTVINSDKITKSRFLLNMDECKQYKEFPELTRDWSSEHRLNSRLSVSGSHSFESPYFTSSQGKCFQNNHRMEEAVESSKCSSITSDNKINHQMLSTQPLEHLESSQSFSPVSMQSNEIINKPLTTTDGNTTKIFQVDLNKVASPKFFNYSVQSCFGTIIKSGRNICYKNLPQLSNMKNNIKTPKSRKCQNFITYGMTIPYHINKLEKSHVFINSSTINQNQETVKRDCNKISCNVKNSCLNSVKQKRSRFSKIKPDLAKHLSSISDSKNKIKNDVEKNTMKDRASMLKRIRNDKKNRHEKLHNGNRKENLKFNFTAEKDKQIQNGLKNTFLVVNSIIQKQGDNVEAPDEPVIQCQENIDNLFCDNELNTSHVQSLTIEDCLINDLNCMPTKNNIITSEEKKSIVSETGHVENHTNNAETLEIITGIESSSQVNSCRVIEAHGSFTEVEISGTSSSEQTDHCKPYQKIKNISDVKVKKPRGRPKKNQNIGRINSILESTFEGEKGCESSQVNFYRVNEDKNSTVVEISNTARSEHEDNSELNQKTKNIISDVKVKKPRGRPKKIQNVGIINSDLELTFEGEKNCESSQINSYKVEEDENYYITEISGTDRSEQTDQCKSNQKIMSISDVKVKKPRGRPKRNQNVGLVNNDLESTFKGENSYESSQINSFRVNEEDKNSITVEISNTARPEQKDYSELNQKIENVISDVKVKKPRGRPKKYQNVEMINENLELTFEGKVDCESSQVNEGNKNSAIAEIFGTGRSEQTAHCDLNQKIETISDVKVKKPRGRPKRNQNVGMINLELTFKGEKGCESSQINSFGVNEEDKNSTAVEISDTPRPEQKDYSELNQKIENVISDVKVKKPRGRPRKYQNVGMINRNLELTFEGKVDCESSQVNSYRLNEGDKNSISVEITGTTKLEQTDHSEPNQKIENVISDVKIKNPRGRPKKYQNVGLLNFSKTLSNADKLDEKKVTYNTKEIMSETPFSATDVRKHKVVYKSKRLKNLKSIKNKKFESSQLEIKKHLDPPSCIAKKRRGRPRKIPSKDLLDTHILDEETETSFSLESTLNVEPESDKNKLIKYSLRGRYMKYKKQTNFKLNLDMSNCLHRMNNKTEEETKSIKSDEKRKEEFQGLKYKRKRKKEKQDETTIFLLKKRKPKMSKSDDFVYQESYDSDSSDTDILESILSDEEDIGVTSFVNRRTSKSFTRSKKLRVAALKEFFHMPRNLLQDFKPQRCTWKPLKDYYSFSPPLRFSPYFKIKNTWNGSESNWISLSVFESASIDQESCHSTFFTGGPVSCSAWCPTSVEDKSIQYVALAVSCSLEEYSFYDQTHSKKGLLQLWSVGTLLDKRLTSRPSMKLSIAYDYGPISDMAWCPKGCWEDPSAECLDNTLPRLGMLAVACSDGNVRIYSIPHPGLLMNESAFPIYESHPAIILQPLFGEICSVTRKSMCTCVSWQKSDNCEKVASGYSNGMICMWHISSIDSFLVSNKNNQTNINPYLVFNAHGTPVTSISLAPLPGSRFLVSSSYDRTLKFWDLLDVSLPYYTVKRGPGRCAEWANHFFGAFASLDNGMNCLRGSCFFKESGTETFPAHSLSNNSSCFVTKSTVSEYLEAQAFVDISGFSSVTFFFNLVKDCQKSPSFFQRPVYLTEIVAVEGIMEKIAFSSYSESRDCLLAIQDMKDIVTLMNETNEIFGRKSSDLDFVDKSEDQEIEGSCSTSISFENILKSENSNVNTGDVHYINVTNELITVKSVSNTCDSNDHTNNQSNNCLPLIQNFDDKPLKENVDQLMLHHENENFNSKNQMYFSGEKIADLLLCDKQSFSDDVVTPESSLDSIISSSHFSSQSDRSNSDLETVDQELNMTFLSTRNQNNGVTASLSPSKLPLELLTLSSESSEVSSCSRKDKYVNLKRDSLSPMFLNQVEAVADQNDKSDKTANTLLYSGKNMPRSRCIALIPSENHLPISNELNKMEIVDTTLESKNVDNTSVETNKKELNNRVLNNTLFTNSSKNLHTYEWNKDIVSVNKLHDTNSGCHKISKYHVALTDNTENLNTKHASMYLEKTYKSDCNMMKPFSKPQKNIFDFKKASKPIVNSDYCTDNKLNRNVTIDNQVCDKNQTPSLSSSYETVISHYGLVFKDMNTAKFKSIEDIKVEEDNSLLHNSCNIASLKTAAWNPNYGCHFWLFSAGQSGLARISYISDMNKSESFPSMDRSNS